MGSHSRLDIVRSSDCWASRGSRFVSREHDRAVHNRKESAALLKAEPRERKSSLKPLTSVFRMSAALLTYPVPLLPGPEVGLLLHH